MASRMSIVSVLFVLVVFFLVDVLSLCGDWKNCKDCLYAQSWKGDKCEWCPLDGKCHVSGDKKSNCTESQNIAHPKECSFYKSEYDPDLAYKLLMHSAVAYSHNASDSIKKGFPCYSFKNVTQIIKPCPKSIGNCSGFTAIQHDTQQIIVAFAAWKNKTTDIEEELLHSPKANATFLGTKVLPDFKKAYDTIWSELKKHVYPLVKKNPLYKIRVTGHSVGGALASMVSTNLALDGNTTLSKIYLYTFGQPRVGNVGYSHLHDSVVLVSWRVVHAKDPVVHTPACLSVPYWGCVPRATSFYHHGTEIFYQKSKMSVDSKYKKCVGLPLDEDKSCSNSPENMKAIMKDTKIAMEDHKQYFGVPVSTWWKIKDPAGQHSKRVCLTKLSTNFATNLKANTVLCALVLQIAFTISAMI